MGLTPKQIEYMVNRFLGWRLPNNFNPDGGIRFEPMGNPGTVHAYKNEPTGTNLLDAEQADAMVRYMIEGLPQAEDDPECRLCHYKLSEHRPPFQRCPARYTRFQPF